jgi:CHRD domain-containing protein
MQLIGTRTFALVGLLAVLGFAAASSAADSMKVTMAPQSGSSESGTATLTKEGVDTTKVVVNLSGATGQQPAHIHKGTCTNLDPKPTYPLSPVSNGKSETVVKASLDDLSKGGYAINVHKSAQDVKTYVSCGEIAAK